MAEKAFNREAAVSQVLPAAAPPRFGSPGSDLRWLLPIALCTGVLALAMLVVVFIPMRQSLSSEPDPVIYAVMSDNLFLLQIRVAIILLTAVLIGGALALAGARQNSRALVRLELRLRRIADGDPELPPTDPAKDFAQFDDVFAYLRVGMDRAARRKSGVLQNAQHALRTLSQQLAANKATLDECRNTVNAVLGEVDTALEADRRAGAAAKVRV